MNTFRRIMALIIAAGMVMGMNCTAFADGREIVEDTSSKTTSYGVAEECDYYIPKNIDDSSQYFRFESMGQRMDSNGYFTFSFSHSLKSSSFRPAQSTICVYASATSSTSNKTYYISLYKSGQSNAISTITYTANGTTEYHYFTGLSTSTSYYLKFTLPILSNATITGSGRVATIQ